MCKDCKAFWGKLVICDFGLYKINRIELNWFKMSFSPRHRPTNAEMYKDDTEIPIIVYWLKILFPGTGNTSFYFTAPMSSYLNKSKQWQRFRAWSQLTYNITYGPENFIQHSEFVSVTVPMHRAVLSIILWIIPVKFLCPAIKKIL